jgi:protein TonB
VFAVPQSLPTSLPTNSGINPDPAPGDPDLTPGVIGPPGGVEGSCPLGSLCGAAAPLPDPVPATVRIGGDIKEPQLIENRPPVYPPMAQAARVGGRVVLEAHVGPDGRVREITIVESHALFNEAALASVRSRRYEPLRLNGVPTDFLITITVAFSVR